jgi:predicted  nucleic acid-binding Zn-ribbon protein
VTPIAGIPGFGPSRRKILADRGLHTAFDVLELAERDKAPWATLHGIGEEGWATLLQWSSEQPADAQAHRDAREERERVEAIAEERRRKADERRWKADENRERAERIAKERRERKAKTAAAREDAQSSFLAALEAIERTVEDLESRRTRAVPYPSRRALLDDAGIEERPTGSYASYDGCLLPLLAAIMFCGGGLWTTYALRDVAWKAYGIDHHIVANALHIALAGVAGVASATTPYLLVAGIHRAITAWNERRHPAKLQRVQDIYDRQVEEYRARVQEVRGRKDTTRARALVQQLREAGPEGAANLPRTRIRFDDDEEAAGRVKDAYARSLVASRIWLDAGSPD